MSYEEFTRKIISELKDKFENIAVRVVDRNSMMLKIWNNQPGVLQTWRDIQVSLLLSKQKRVAVLELRASSPDELLAVARRVGDLMPKVEESELPIELPEPGKPAPLEGGYDKKVLEYSSDPKLLVEAMVSSALSAGAERTAGTLELEEVSTTIATSKGFEGTYKKTGVVAHLRSFKDDVSSHWAWGSTAVDVKKLEEVGAKSASFLSLAKSKTSFEPGKYDVILSPLVAGNLLNYVASMSSGMSVLLGMSFLSRRKVGEVVASEVFTLVDAPRDTSLPGLAPFDDEGVETYNKPIINRGKFVSLIHNTATGKVFNAKSTGNAGWINPRPWNLIVEPGISSFDKMVSEMRRGYFILNNWYTRLQNYVEGQFSTVARDLVLEIRDGSIVGYVDRVRIAERFENLLKSVKELSKEVYDITWWEVRIPTRAPYILAENINLTKPSI